MREEMPYHSDLEVASKGIRFHLGWSNIEVPTSSALNTTYMSA